VDFPLPVLPTIPIFFPPVKVQVIPCNTNGNFGPYRTCQIYMVASNNRACYKSFKSVD
jgi:hypothetical protein